MFSHYLLYYYIFHTTNATAYLVYDYHGCLYEAPKGQYDYPPDITGIMLYYRYFIHSYYSGYFFELPFP